MHEDTHTTRAKGLRMQGLAHLKDLAPRRKAVHVVLYSSFSRAESGMGAGKCFEHWKFPNARPIMHEDTHTTRAGGLRMQGLTHLKDLGPRRSAYFAVCS